MASLPLRKGSIEDVLLLGRGTFMVLLSVEGDVPLLLEQSPLSFNDKLLFLFRWYSDFDTDSFDDRCQVPRFPVKLSFPGLPAQFRVSQAILQFGSIFGTPFPASVQLQASVPSVKVAVVPSLEFPDAIRYEWDEVIRSQRLVVTGRPNQCLRCHVVGHLFKDCPNTQTRFGHSRTHHSQARQAQHSRVQFSETAGRSQRQRSGQAESHSSSSRQSQRAPVRPLDLTRKVYRRRERPAVEQQLAGRPPEGGEQDFRRGLDPIQEVEEQPLVVPPVAVVSSAEVAVVAEDSASEVPSEVPLSSESGHAGVGETECSSPRQFSSVSETPLSMVLPGFFFALGPWRRPEEQLRSGPLQIDVFLLVESATGDPVFWGLRTLPMVRFLFETLHDHAWDEEMIANALFDQVFAQAVRFLGPEVHRHLAPQFEDALGRLVWSDRASLWSLPMVFFMDPDQSPPTQLRVWSVSRAADFLQVGCVELVEWMLDIFHTQSPGFSVIWTV